MNKQDLWEALKTIPESDRSCDNCDRQQSMEACIEKSPSGLRCITLIGDFGPNSAWKHKKDE